MSVHPASDLTAGKIDYKLASPSVFYSVPSSEESMSLEDAVQRLVNVLGTQEPNAAVREIIRQRDEAQQNFAAARRSAETYERYYLECDARYAKLNRVVSSLRGVITRMKRASSGL